MQKIQDLHVITTEALVAPRLLKAELAIDERIARSVVEARQTVRRIIRGEDSRLMCIVGPVLDSRPGSRARLRPAAGPAARAARGAPVHRDARVFRKAAHHGRLEGADQRSAHGRQLRHARAGLRSRARLLLDITRSGCRRPPRCSTRSRRSTSPTWSPGRRSARARPSRKLIARWRADCRCRSDSRTAPTATCRSRSTRSSRRAAPHSFLGINQDGDDGDRAHRRQSRHPRGAARRASTPNYDAASIEECGRMLREGRPGAARDGRLLARADEQGLYASSPKCSRRCASRFAPAAAPSWARCSKVIINAGNQPLAADRSQLKYGVSITDPCIDWPTTERCLLDAAEALAPSGRVRAAASER